MAATNRHKLIPHVRCLDLIVNGTTVRSRITWLVISDPSASTSVTDDAVELAWVDQDCTGERAATAAAGHGIALEVVKLPEAERGFVLLPRRWVVERFAWATRFRRLVKNYERYAETLAGLQRLRLPLDETGRSLAAGS